MRGETRWCRAVRRLRDGAMQCDHVRLPARADVERTDVLRLERQDVGLRHVSHVDGVARLPSLAIDCAGRAGETLNRKDQIGRASCRDNGCARGWAWG